MHAAVRAMLTVVAYSVSTFRSNPADPERR